MKPGYDKIDENTKDIVDRITENKRKYYEKRN
jgi:hypothetical protein